MSVDPILQIERAIKQLDSIIQKWPADDQTAQLRWRRELKLRLADLKQAENNCQRASS